jgi:hypothetical protein
LSIVNRPANIEKGQPQLFTLNKAELEVHALVVMDDYFSNKDNWATVVVVFKSTSGNQGETLVFNATLAEPTAFFAATDRAHDTFEVEQLSIYDFDWDYLKIDRVNLIAVDFDMEFTNNLLTTEDEFILVTEDNIALSTDS